MTLLPDTHVPLWWPDDPARLTAAARRAIEDPANVALVGAASVWEIAIKRAIGKLSAPADLLAAVAAGGFDRLAVTAEHAPATESLPMHHGDPFDRMLIAQALAVGAVLVTRDAVIRRYPVPVLRA